MLGIHRSFKVGHAGLPTARRQSVEAAVLHVGLLLVLSTLQELWVAAWSFRWCQALAKQCCCCGSLRRIGDLSRLGIQ